MKSGPIMLVALAILNAACGASGVFKTDHLPRFDESRIVRSDEAVGLRIYRNRGITTAPTPTGPIQDLALVVELAPPHQWPHLAGAFSAYPERVPADSMKYELTVLGHARVEVDRTGADSSVLRLVDPDPHTVRTYASIMSDYRQGKSIEAAFLQSIQTAGWSGTLPILLACRHRDQVRCFEPGNAYVLRVRPPNAAPVLYRFRVEKRNAFITFGIGLLLMTALLATAG